MKNSELGYVPEPDYFEHKLRSMQQFHDEQAGEVLVREKMTRGHLATW